jgi:DnaK suppressor protein
MAKRTTRRTSKRPRATAADILGPVEPPARIPRKWSKHYKRLSETRDHLANRKGTLVEQAREDQPAYSLHIADAGTDNYDRDFALSMASSEQVALYEVDEAINRIKNGSYGVCELTGKPIEPERLEAVPWARFSAAAERQLEEQGAVERPRLGARVEMPKVTPEEEAEED